MCAKVHANDRLHVRATTPYARIDRRPKGRPLFARFPSKLKKAPLSFFRMFRLAEQSPRETLRLADRLSIADELWFMPYSRGTSGEGLRLEWVLPGAARIGHNSVPKGEAFVSF